MEANKTTTGETSKPKYAQRIWFYFGYGSVCLLSYFDDCRRDRAKNTNWTGSGLGPCNDMETSKTRLVFQGDLKAALNWRQLDSTRSPDFFLIWLPKVLDNIFLPKFLWPQQISCQRCLVLVSSNASNEIRHLLGFICLMFLAHIATTCLTNFVQFHCQAT